MGSMGAMGLSLPDHIKYITSHTHFLILVISRGTDTSYKSKNPQKIKGQTI